MGRALFWNMVLFYIFIAGAFIITFFNFTVIFLILHSVLFGNSLTTKQKASQNVNWYIFLSKDMHCNSRFFSHFNKNFNLQGKLLINFGKRQPYNSFKTFFFCLLYEFVTQNEDIQIWFTAAYRVFVNQTLLLR